MGFLEIWRKMFQHMRQFSNQSYCQNVDGFSSEGCSAGYKGFLCTERKYNVCFIDI